MDYLTNEVSTLPSNLTLDPTTTTTTTTTDLPNSKPIQSPQSAYNSLLAGHGRSPLTRDPSFAQSPEAATVMAAAATTGSHLLPVGLPSAFGSSQVSGSKLEQSSMLFTMFTTCIVALVIYTMMNMLSNKLTGGMSMSNNRHHQADGLGHQGYHQANTRTTDLRRDKRKLTRMNRDERVRRLISHHGGKNVSNAIRFLVSELAKQKLSLIEGLAANGELEQRVVRGEQWRNDDDNGQSSRVGCDYDKMVAKQQCACTCHALSNGKDINSNNDDGKSTGVHLDSEDSELNRTKTGKTETRTKLAKYQAVASDLDSDSSSSLSSDMSLDSDC